MAGEEEEGGLATAGEAGVVGETECGAKRRAVAGCVGLEPATARGGGEREGGGGVPVREKTERWVAAVTRREEFMMER